MYIPGQVRGNAVIYPVLLVGERPSCIWSGIWVNLLNFPPSGIWVNSFNFSGTEGCSQLSQKHYQRFVMLNANYSAAPEVPPYITHTVYLRSVHLSP